MRLIAIIAVCYFLISCESQKELTFGTFNIAWLGDGIDDKTPRQPQDYANIKELISSLEVDILALQEIENYDAVTKIVDTNIYRIIIASFPKEQKTALIINKNIEVLDTFELDKIALGNEGLRPGLMAYCKFNGSDFFVGSFHFKSTSRYDDTPDKRTLSFEMRKEQSGILLEEMKRLTGIKSDKDIVLLGDFNDNPTKKNSNITSLENDDYDFLTGDMISCKYSIWKSIDHIIVSKSIETKVKNNSLMMVNVNSMFSEEYAKNISDHCPVIVRIALD